MGQKMLTGVQLGKEVTLGTPVAATAIMSGLTTARHRLMVNNLHPEEFRGDMFKFHKSAVVGRRGELRLEGYACYDDLCYLLGMALQGGVTGVSDAGSPPAYTYSYTPVGSDLDTPSLYTIEVGDDSQYYRYQDCFATQLQVSADVDGLTKFSSSILARDRAAQAKTPALSQRDPEYLAGNLWTFAIDNTGGTLGTTAYTGCILNFQWSISQFLSYKCMDGTQLWTGISEQGLVAGLTMTVMVDSAFSAMLTRHLNQTRVLVRLENLGSQIHGSSPAYKRMRIDGAYVLKDIGEIGGSDEAGKQTVQLTFESEYDSTAALYYKVAMQNALSALP